MPLTVLTEIYFAKASTEKKRGHKNCHIEAPKTRCDKAVSYNFLDNALKYYIIHDYFLIWNKTGAQSAKYIKHSHHSKQMKEH